ncbi:MAG: RidA family protein, partial [Deltaproteobacteria bacterium]|nr:RidA family protein [Deltaproteobacteria bacterium]
ATDQAPGAIGPYSQAIATDTLLFISGQLPIDPADGKMVEGTIDARTHQIINNAGEIAKAAGTDLANVVKTTIFLTDLADFQAVNSAYGEHFPEAPPARSTVQVAALPLGSNIEIEFILTR